MDDVGSVIEETPAQKWRRRIIKTIMRTALVVVVYFAIVLVARLLHRRVLYQPPSETKTALPEGVTLLNARAADGVPVIALDLAAAPEAPPSPSSPSAVGVRARGALRDKATDGKPEPPKVARTIVHFHGNAENAEDNLTLARDLRKHGLEVVLVEYRGYGRSRGEAKPTEEGLYADAEAVLDALAARGKGKDEIVLFGQALGAGVATEMARRGRGARLVLVAPFTSTVDLARRVAPFFPESIVMADKFDNLEKAPSIGIPTLVVHGRDDDVIPFELGERVEQAIPHAELLAVDGARHDNLYKSTAVITAIASLATR